MAEVEVVYGRRLGRVSWGALLAGFFVGAGVLFLLLSLGAAVGFTSVDGRDLSSWKNMGIGVGIWGGVAAIIASFCSAWAAGRLSAPERTSGMLHGAALWGLTWFVGLWIGAAAAVGVAQGAGQAAQQAAQQAGPGAAQQAQQQAQSMLDRAQQQGGPLGERAAGGGKAGAWGAFLAALFTLAASGLGGASGAGSRARAVARRTAALGELAPQRT